MAQRQWLDLDTWKALVLEGKAPSDVALRKGYTAEVAVMKAADGGESRILGFTISTGSVDRERDTIDPKGWELDNYKRNPVVLWAHSYRDLPVGRAVAIEQTKTGLTSLAEFVPRDISEFADTVYQLLRGGYLRATSVGFAPMKHAYVEERRGVDFMQQELLEYSIVPVPANPEALMDAKGQGIDVAPLRQWAERVLDDGRGGLWLPKDQVERVFAVLGTHPMVNLPAAGLTVVTAASTAPECEFAPEAKPYPNEHACRVADPKDFSEFRRGERSHDGKIYGVIYGKPKDGGGWREQGYRYPKDTWSTTSARSHCGTHGGAFEAASEGKAPAECPNAQCPKGPTMSECPAGHDCPMQGAAMSGAEVDLTKCAVCGHSLDDVVMVGYDRTAQAFYHPDCRPKADATAGDPPPEPSEVVLRFEFEDVDETVLLIADGLEEQSISVDPSILRDVMEAVFTREVRRQLAQYTGRVD